MDVEIYEQFYRLHDVYRFRLTGVYLDEDDNRVVVEAYSEYPVSKFENTSSEYSKSYLKYLINKERQEFCKNLFDNVIGESTNEKIDRMFPDV